MNDPRAHSMHAVAPASSHAGSVSHIMHQRLILRLYNARAHSDALCQYRTFHSTREESGPCYAVSVPDTL
eukprot:3437698-Rhodomonas_salina.1